MDLKALRELVDEQAEDEGLWAIAETIHEAYIQQELRKLHAAIEDFIDVEAQFDRPPHSLKN